MTIMNTELYEALIEAGASDKKAKAASNIMEEQNKRFDKIDNRFDTMQSDIDHRFDTMQNDIDRRFDGLEKDMSHGFKLIDKKFDLVDHKFEAISKDLKITIGGYFIVAVGVILAAIKLMS